MNIANRIQQLNSKYHQQPNVNVYHPPSEFENNLVPSSIIREVRQEHRRIEVIEGRSRSVSRSRVVAGSRVVVSQTPAVVETRITAPKVYQIVQPIIQITPTIISQHKVERRVIQNQQRNLQVAIKEVEEGSIPSPPPLNFRKKNKGKFVRKDCWERCGGNCQSCTQYCSSWLCCLLILLMLLSAIVGIILYKPNLFQNTFIGNLFKSNHNKIPTPHPTTNSSVTNPQEDKQYLKQIQDILKSLNKTKVQAQNSLANQTLTNSSKQSKQADKHSPSISTNIFNRSSTTITNVTCPPGFFFFGSKCLSCPDQSVWNGTTCTKRVLVQGGQKTQESQPKQPNVKQEGNNNINNNNQKPTNKNSDSEIYVANAWSVVQPKKHLLRSD